MEREEDKMPVLNVYKLDGSQSGTVEVKDEIFGIEPNKTVMHKVFSSRIGKAKTKYSLYKNKS